MIYVLPKLRGFFTAVNSHLCVPQICAHSLAVVNGCLERMLATLGEINRAGIILHINSLWKALKSRA